MRTEAEIEVMEQKLQRMTALEIEELIEKVVQEKPEEPIERQIENYLFNLLIEHRQSEKGKNKKCNL